MNKIYISIIVVMLFMAGFFAYDRIFQKPDVIPTTADALNIAYTIEGHIYNLINGKAKIESAPGSSSKNVATIFGEVTYGDLNNDGVKDAGVLISLDTGGSGTFYYLTAALSKDNEYKSTNAILIGDRIAPQNISIENSKLIANYADRGPKDPITVTPYIGATKRAYVDNEELKELEILRGRIVWGHEVRTFQLCAKGSEDPSSIESAWIEGGSPVLDSIKTTYEREMAGSGPYASMYAEVIGKEIAPVRNGFGSEYAKAISIEELTLASAIGSCKRDLIILENIKPGSYIDTKNPLELKGMARGNWYFEASFPIQVLDRHANVLASGIATAQGEWMTTEFVSFTSTLKFTKTPEANSFGKIVLHKDNPSDMREFDDQLEVLVYFK